MTKTTLPEYLLVDPQLTGDPLERQGRIGLLVAAYGPDDAYFIRFEDGMTGEYKGENLLTLKSNAEIFQYLDANGWSIPKADFRALYNITLFQEHDTLVAQKKALELARTNPLIISVSLATLAEQQSRDVGTSAKR